jgi:hypothetical protein
MIASFLPSSVHAMFKNCPSYDIVFKSSACGKDHTFTVPSLLPETNSEPSAAMDKCLIMSL